MRSNPKGRCLTARETESTYSVTVDLGHLEACWHIGDTGNAASTLSLEGRTLSGAAAAHGEAEFLSHLGTQGLLGDRGIVLTGK